MIIRNRRGVLSFISFPTSWFFILILLLASAANLIAAESRSSNKKPGPTPKQILDKCKTILGDRVPLRNVPFETEDPTQRWIRVSKKYEVLNDNIQVHNLLFRDPRFKFLGGWMTEAWGYQVSPKEMGHLVLLEFSPVPIISGEIESERAKTDDRRMYIQFLAPSVIFGGEPGRSALDKLDAILDPAPLEGSSKSPVEKPRPPVVVILARLKNKTEMLQCLHMGNRLLEKGILPFFVNSDEPLGASQWNRAQFIERFKVLMRFFNGGNQNSILLGGLGGEAFLISPLRDSVATSFRDEIVSRNIVYVPTIEKSFLSGISESLGIDERSPFAATLDQTLRIKKVLGELGRNIRYSMNVSQVADEPLGLSGRLNVAFDNVWEGRVTPPPLNWIPIGGISESQPLMRYRPYALKRLISPETLREIRSNKRVDKDSRRGFLKCSGLSRGDCEKRVLYLDILEAQVQSVIFGSMSMEQWELNKSLNPIKDFSTFAEQKNYLDEELVQLISDYRTQLQLMAHLENTNTRLNDEGLKSWPTDVRSNLDHESLIINILNLLKSMDAEAVLEETYLTRTNRIESGWQLYAALVKSRNSFREAQTEVANRLGQLLLSRGSMNLTQRLEAQSRVEAELLRLNLKILMNIDMQKANRKLLVRAFSEGKLPNSQLAPLFLPKSKRELDLRSRELRDKFSNVTEVQEWLERERDEILQNPN